MRKVHSAEVAVTCCLRASHRSGARSLLIATQRLQQHFAPKRVCSVCIALVSDCKVQTQHAQLDKAVCMRSLRRYLLAGQLTAIALGGRVAAAQTPLNLTELGANHTLASFRGLEPGSVMLKFAHAGLRDQDAVQQRLTISAGTASGALGALTCAVHPGIVLGA